MSHTHDQPHAHAPAPAPGPPPPHSHSHSHSHEGDFDWVALGAHLEREAELHAPAFGGAVEWLGELAADGGAGVRRILDVGSGPGVVTCLLADAFPQAETVAVDQAAGLLERVRERADARGPGPRVRVQQAELPGEFETLGTADLLWSSNVVHHLGDQAKALRSLGERLRPGGVLAVAEGGLPLRCLPRDIGLGRPGLLVRMEAATSEVFAAMRDRLPERTPVVEDWPALLAGAGLLPTGTRTFLADHPSPLGLTAREHLHAQLSRQRDQIGDRLDAEDRAALDTLLDADSPSGILWRPDAFYLTALTVHTARRP